MCIRFFRSKVQDRFIWVGINSIVSKCDLKSEEHGFCSVDGTPFTYGKSWWTESEPNSMPNSCAVVGGDMGKLHMDVPCTDSKNVDVVCEIGEIKGGKSGCIFRSHGFLLHFLQK